jgi:hypothetical protein
MWRLIVKECRDLWYLPVAWSTVVLLLVGSNPWAYYKDGAHGLLTLTWITTALIVTFLPTIFGAVKRAPALLVSPREFLAFYSVLILVPLTISYCTYARARKAQSR